MYNQKLWPLGYAQKHEFSSSKLNQRALQAKEKIKSIVEPNEVILIAQNTVEKVEEPILTEVSFEEVTENNSKKIERKDWKEN